MARPITAAIHSCSLNKQLSCRKQFPQRIVGGSFVVLATLLIVGMLRTPMMAQSVQGAAFVDAACQELLVNGDVESPTSGNWRFGSTAAPGVAVTDPAHGGAGAIRLGIPTTASNKLTHSTTYQTVTIPNSAQQVTLTYWERVGSSGDANDRREILVLNSNFNVMAQIDVTAGSGNDTWTKRSVDLLTSLPNLPNQTVVLYWNVYNNGNGTTLVNYLDDFSLQACDSTAAPTATVTTPAITPVATPTVISTPDPVRVRVGTVTVTEGTTAATVPLDVIVLTDRVTVGVLSASVEYDATLLKATSCSQEGPMDLLLCNIVTPGLIQLAVVSALGIRDESTITNLAFDLLQDTDRNTPLTLDLNLITDGSGAVVGATPLNGSIDLSCTPDIESCKHGNTIYLPLIQR